MRSLLIVFSYHHHNTERIAKAFSRVLDAEIRTPRQIGPGELHGFDLVGFGSGIYGGRHHHSLLSLIDSLPEEAGRRAFIFSTCGVPMPALSGARLRERFDRSRIDNHAALRERLRSKGYLVQDEFSCAGLNTNSFLRLFGGLNKGRPSEEDLSLAEEFANHLTQGAGAPRHDDDGRREGDEVNERRQEA